MIVTLNSKTIITINGRKYALTSFGGTTAPNTLLKAPVVELIPMDNTNTPSEKITLEFSQPALDGSSSVLGLSTFLADSE
jgi:hypothetical protein